VAKTKTVPPPREQAVVIAAGTAPGTVEIRRPLTAPTGVMSGPEPRKLDVFVLTLEQAEELLARMPGTLAAAVFEAKRKHEDERHRRADELQRELEGLRLSKA
jgi:hypothetical protein